LPSSYGGEEDEASLRAYWRRSAQVPPSLYSFEPAMWSSSISAVGPPSTSIGRPTSTSLPTTFCYSSSSVTCWDRFAVLQLWACWALHSRVSPASSGHSPRAPSPPSSPQKVMIRAPSLRVGHPNFTTVEDILAGEEVLTGTFFLFGYPIIILFDSRASPDFMSLACAQKAKLTLYATKVPYSISTLKWSVKSHTSLSGECFRPVLLPWKAIGSMSFLVMN
jgi:hypothetical protein